jgi:hypothetical protein
MDQPLAVGDEDMFWFDLDRVPDLVFSVPITDRSYPKRARIDRVTHSKLGAVAAVENKEFSYLFRLADGRCIQVDAEQSPGTVESGGVFAEDWTLQVNLAPLPDETAEALERAIRREALHPSMVAVLVKAQASCDHAIRIAAQRAVAALGEVALGALIEVLESSDDEIRYEALRRLLELGSRAREALPALIALARRETGRICYRAAQASRAAGCTEAQWAALLASKGAEERARILAYVLRP